MSDLTVMVLTSFEKFDISSFLREFTLQEQPDLFSQNERSKRTRVELVKFDKVVLPKFTNEFWTSKQRRAASLQEVSYRACFKPQLPRFFIEILTKPGDLVYDPFAGRGTTIIEAALLGRNVVGNDINPLSSILTLPRLRIPDLADIEKRLNLIFAIQQKRRKRYLTMFYHRKTLNEIIILRNYLCARNEHQETDTLDSWIRMVATNRLTGHSPGFFSVYTLPPNQAVSRKSQRKINRKRNQRPEYRNTREIILKKSKQLISGLTTTQIHNLDYAVSNARFLTRPAHNTPEIGDCTVQLTVTSPPFLDVVQYAKDNWLRCWFNCIDVEEIASRMTSAKTPKTWAEAMQQVFLELYRITRRGGWVAFEVGEVKAGQVKLEEYVVPLGVNAGFTCEGILVNKQEFTKTANIWGIKNNAKGTNTNRVVIFHKKQQIK